MKKVLKKILRHTGFELERITNHNDIFLYKSIYSPDSIINRRFYNISAGAYKGFGGGIKHPCWTNIDVDKPWKTDKYFPNGKEFDPRKDIAHDLLSLKPLPVDNMVAELVHSRFTVDRLTDEAAQYFFNEVYRILKYNGVFRIVSTNLDLDYRAYRNNDKSYFFWLGDKFSIEQAFLFHMVTQVSTHYSDHTTNKITDEELKILLSEKNYEDVMTFCSSKCSLEVHKRNRYDHLNWWNLRKYKKMLDIAGFKMVYQSAPEQSVSPVLRNSFYFDNDHNNVMMYIEAIKI
jgi:predicted SAM-dependent methyltransferase